MVSTLTLWMNWQNVFGGKIMLFSWTTCTLLFHFFCTYWTRKHACGTLRANRKFLPPDIRKKKVAGLQQCGDSRGFQSIECPNLCCVAWQDTSLVRFLSTCCKPNVTGTTLRRVAAQYVQVRQPKVAAYYAKHYGAIDYWDQLHAAYSPTCTCKKMWWFLFWFLNNACLINGWILYKKASTRANPLHRKHYEQSDFCFEIAMALIGDYKGRKQSASSKPLHCPTECCISSKCSYECIKR